MQRNNVANFNFLIRSAPNLMQKSSIITAGIFLCHLNMKQGVARTRRNRTGAFSVGGPTAYAPGIAAADRPRAQRPPHPPAGNVTDDDRGETTTDASEQNNTGPLGGPVINN